MINFLEIRHKLLVYEASRWIGTQEIGGNNHGQDVERFQRATSGRAIGQPWCADFTFFCIEQVDRLVNEMSDLCISGQMLYKSELVMDVWRKSTVDARCIIKPGCLIIWQHWKDGKETNQGHIGIVEKIYGAYATVIEGNTGPDVGSVNREGDGVYRKMRSMIGDQNMRVLGFLDPWFDAKLTSDGI